MSNKIETIKIEFKRMADTEAYRREIECKLPTTYSLIDSPRHKISIFKRYGKKFQRSDRHEIHRLAMARDATAYTIIFEWRHFYNEQSPPEDGVQRA